MTAEAVPLHRALGLDDVELDAIREKLGRDPNDLELAMFSVMWSEHCSYKRAGPLLRTLPTKGEDVVAGHRRAGRRHRDRRRARGGVQDREPQPPVRGRAVPGRGDRRRRHPARRLRDGRPPDRGPRRAPLRRPVRRPDAPPRRRRRARRRRLRQLRRRAHGGRRARVRPVLPGQPAGQRDGHRPARGRACSPAPPRTAPATSSCSTAPRPVATASAGRPSSPPPPSATRTRPSARRSRWATRSPRSC